MKIISPIPFTIFVAKYNSTIMSKKFTVTAALPYANGPLHLGHVAGVYLPADIFVRFKRMKKEDVLFVCGSDEHGAAITLRAKKEGITPKDIVDKYHGLNKKAFADFDISFDIYSRTSNPMHHETAQEYFKVLDANGSFTKKTTDQYYDQEFNQFLADRYITGTCPICKNENAYGDQCERCGSALSPLELINPISTLSGKSPELKQTTHWFLPMDRHEGWLKDWITKGLLDGVQQHDPKTWRNQVNGQCMSWIDGGLHPRAMTRDLDWGVKVPVEGGDGKVLYVWFDAPIGYISSTKEWAEKEGKDWEPYWKDENTKLLHFIGKDNIVFHCIIFPSMLKADGSYILPNNVPANEFLNLEGNKISTSKNWAVWLHEYLEDFPNQQDVLRYALTANAPETKDNDFTWADFQARNNNELVAIYGNFINRVIVLTNKYYNGIVPESAAFSEVDTATLNELKAYPNVIESSIERYRFREAQAELMNVARLGNKYLADEEPWKKIKTDEERTQTIMFVSLQIAAALAVLCEPFLPFTSSKLKNILVFKELNTTWGEVSTKDVLLPSGHQIGKGELLFSKIEDEQVQQQLDKLAATKKANEVMNASPGPQKDTIQFDDFTKLDMRVGTILEATKMAKTKKLLILKVDTGIDVRTIVSGIAESFSPEEVVGKKVTVLINLAPRALRGVESEGMILMTENAEGKLVFLNPDQAGDIDIANGATIN